MITPTDTLQSQMDHFVEICQKNGIRATHQRREIFRELLTSRAHPDAESLYQAVHERIPSISRDTVYRSLKTLEQIGLAVRVGPNKEGARFDANREEHFHFVCSRCGEIEDCAADWSFPVNALSGKSVGKIQSVYVEYRGICRGCEKRGE